MPAGLGRGVGTSLGRGWLKSQGAAPPRPSRRSLRALSPRLRAILTVFPSVTSASSATIPPTYLGGPVTVSPTAPESVTSSVVTVSVTTTGTPLSVTTGAVPKIRLVGVRARYAVEILHVSDGIPTGST